MHGRGSPLCAGERVGLRSSTRSARGARRCHTRCAGVPSRRKFHDCIFARSLSTFRRLPAGSAGRAWQRAALGNCSGSAAHASEPNGRCAPFCYEKTARVPRAHAVVAVRLCSRRRADWPAAAGCGTQGKTRGRPAPANFRDVRGDVASLSARLSAAPGLRSRPGAASLVLREPLRQRRAAARPTAACRGARALSVDLSFSLSVPRRRRLLPHSRTRGFTG